MQALTAMKEKIDFIIDMSCGENFTARSKGYTHGLIVTLPSKDDLPKYSGR